MYMRVKSTVVDSSRRFGQEEILYNDSVMIEENVGIKLEKASN